MSKTFNIAGIPPGLRLDIPNITYLKDPESSELGKKIISGSIDLLHENGFDDFTFRKLADSIDSTEASVYRYFENKHKLLLYLIIWYWQWTEYRLIFGLANVSDPEIKLRRCLQILTEAVEEDSAFSHINEVKLHQIVINEAAKTYLTKAVDVENKTGVFRGFKRVIALVSNVVLEINPSFKYPHMLISTVVEGAHHQRFFAQHLPSLTDPISSEDSISNFYSVMVLQTINYKG